MRKGLTKTDMVEKILNDSDAYDAGINCNTPYCSIVSAGGMIIQNSVTLDNNGATDLNLFKVTGAVRILQVYGVCTEATDSTTFSTVGLNSYDGTTETAMTASTNASGISAKDLLVKSGNISTDLEFLEGSSASYHEGTTDKKAFEEGILFESSAGDTYLRLGYTGDSDTDIDITWVVRWQPLTSTSVLEAV